MTSVLMGRFAFYAQASILSNLFPLDSTSRVSPNPSPHMDIPLLGEALFKEADRIIGLPGLAYDPGFQQYAGYLTVDTDHQRKLFYWYVESQNDPETDPVVFWTNGGPGCSGLLGFGTEHGPFYISQTGDLTPNPYSWNSLANMLYMEQPAGVGFSYSEKNSDYSTGDSKVASDAFEFIVQFFNRFPERLSNPFYVASESYGGHYIPQCKYYTRIHGRNGPD
jgi:cathepsin A (carboxypeptidase C)